MMKLTVQMKNQIINAIMADIPEHNYHQDAKDLVLPVVVDKLPAAIRRIYDDNALAPYLKHMVIRPRSNAGLTVSIPSAEGSYTTDILQYLDVKTLNKFEALGVAMREARQKRQNMMSELMRSFKLVSTFKQFEDAFPKLKRYLPTPERPVPNLPATTDLMDNLKKIGWPKK